MQFVFTPRVQTRLADTETPVSIYLKIRDHFPESILMESGDHSASEHRYSYICCKPLATFSVKEHHITIGYPNGDKTVRHINGHTDVMQTLDSFMDCFSIETQEELYHTKGLYGYINYDAVQHFETVTLRDRTLQSRQTDDIHFSFYGIVIVFDHHKNVCHIIDFNDDSAIHLVESLLRHQISHYPFKIKQEEQSSCSDEAFLELIQKGKEHCYRGDVFQIVLSRSFSTKFSGDDFNVYRSLRSINPSPYLFYFDYGGYHLFGSSPEAQLKIEDHKASIHPIAGTYKRTGNLEKDALLADQLREDQKENAEHTMLVDLARNDLSKNYSEVNVIVYKDIRMFSHVIHMVSEVTGARSVENTNALKVIADTFPAGTLSGAPKYKAIQLIDSYETQSRGFYGGSIGFIGFNGDFNQAIMIRTFLSKDQSLTYQAGAGVVASSIPQHELQEVDNKLRALRTALQLAQTS